MHPGIEIRITTPAGVVVNCDSDFMHYSTLFRGVPMGQWIVLLRHLEGGGLLDDGLALDVGPLPASLTIEIRAVELADVEAPDDARQLVELDQAGVGDAWAAATWAAITGETTTAPPGSGVPGGAVVEGGQAAADGGESRRRPGRSRWPAGRWWPGRRPR